MNVHMPERLRSRRSGTRMRQVLMTAFQPDWRLPARLPAMLHAAGCEVTAFAPLNSHARRSGYVRRYMAAPSDTNEYFDALCLHLESDADRYTWVLPATDADVRGLYARRHEAWAAEVFPANAASPDANAVVSKLHFAKLLDRLGVATPRSRAVRSAEEAQAAALEIGFPVILKPSEGWAGSGTMRADNVAGVARAFTRATGQGEVIVQRFHTGRVGSAMAVYCGGYLNGWVTAYKLLTFPGPYSPSCYRVFRPLPAIEPPLRAIGKTLGLHGVMGFDFIEEAETGAITFLELNPRPGAIAYTFAATGVSPEEMLGGLIGHAAPAVAPQPAVDISLPLFPQDLVRGIQQSDWLSLISFVTAPREWRDVPWREPRLLAAELRTLFWHARDRLLR